jgi:hypothetical protein
VGGFLSIFLDPTTEITSLVAGPDLIYYERDQGLPGSFNGTVALDQLLIEVSNDGSAWTTVYWWGDADPANNGSLGATAPENDNLVLAQSDPRLVGFVPYKTGVAIDLDAFPVTLPIRFIRLTNLPDGDTDGTEVDAILILRP